MNSREKGKRGERQWRDELRAAGYAARRGQQFSGSPDSPDVVCDALPWAHFEVKAVERLNIEDAMEQARRDCDGKVPVVAHKRNHRRWLVTMEAETFFKLLRGDFPMSNPPQPSPQRGEGARYAGHEDLGT
jgi:Holliday junction resolvase